MIIVYIVREGSWKAQPNQLKMNDFVNHEDQGGFSFVGKFAGGRFFFKETPLQAFKFQSFHKKDEKLKRSQKPSGKITPDLF
ncbi:MAG: hypothetical protein Q4G69_07605 [Planctomycetia bacterium]|nr:hypothetical protein [Planctomycetia bacterium]